MAKQSKLYSVLLLSLILLLSCKIERENKLGEKKILSPNAQLLKDKTSKKNNDTLPKERKDNYDILLLDSLKLRNKKLYISKNLFNSVWKIFDSISKPYIADCGYLEGETILTYYFNGIIFNTYQDVAELESIDFKISNESLIYTNITFNKNTSINEIKDKFKIAYKEREIKKTNGDQYITLRFRTREKWDEYIHLLFKNDKLIHFIIWNPC